MLPPDASRFIAVQGTIPPAALADDMPSTGTAPPVARPAPVPMPSGGLPSSSSTTPQQQLATPPGLTTMPVATGDVMLVLDASQETNPSPAAPTPTSSPMIPMPTPDDVDMEARGLVRAREEI